MAPIFATTTAVSVVTGAYSDLAIMVALVIGGVIAAWAGLVGLGFAKRKATHHVTGRKF